MVEARAARARQESEDKRALGLPQATALIMGSIIGVGIFNLPFSLASIGTDQHIRDGAHHAGRDRDYPRGMKVVDPRRIPTFRASREVQASTREEMEGSGSGRRPRGGIVRRDR
jgi:hypothetical protein